MKAVGSPRQSEARLEALRVCIVQGPAVAVPTGEELLAGAQIVRGLAVVNLYVGSDVFVAQPEIDGQVAA